MTAISSAAEQAPVAAPLVGRPDVNRKRMARLGWMFSAPALIIVGAVTIFPIVYSVVISLSNVTVSGNGIALNGFTTAATTRWCSRTRPGTTRSPSRSSTRSSPSWWSWCSAR